MSKRLKIKLGQSLVPALLSCSALLFSSSLLAHTEEAQFFGDQIPDPELSWWLAHDWYASSVAISGDTAAVGAAHEGGATSGAIYIYVRDGTGAWTEEAKIPNPTGVYNFGVSVSIHNDTLLVTALDAGDYQGTGFAYIYVRTGTSWTLQASLFGDSNDLDGFGYAGSVHDDTAAVTAWHDDDHGGNAGAVHIYKRTGTTWSREAKLYASDVQINDHFGRAVDIEGDTLAVNSMLNLNPAGLYAGNAYVFVRQNGIWVEQSKLEASDGSGADNMGVSLDINGDFILAGALGDDSAVGDVQRGSAYVFRRNKCNWLEDAKLVPDESNDYMYFGRDLAIQGNVVIVGAENDDDLGDSTGAAYVFSRSTGSWVQDSKIVPTDAAGGVVSGTRFGTSIDLDNDKAVIGGSPGIQGKVYMYDLDNDNLAFPPKDKVCFDGCHP
jgi:hypothetical protein